MSRLDYPVTAGRSRIYILTKRKKSPVPAARLDVALGPPLAPVPLP